MISQKNMVDLIHELDEDSLRLWIRRDWIRPKDLDGEHVFTEVDIARVRMICDFRLRMQIDEEATELMLKLIDQAHGLRIQLAILSQALSNLPDDIRQTVREYVSTHSFDGPTD